LGSGITSRQVAFHKRQKSISDFLRGLEGPLDEGEETCGLRELEAVPSAHTLKKSDRIHGQNLGAGTPKCIPPNSRTQESGENRRCDSRMPAA
jgi:hypothetical protein